MFGNVEVRNLVTALVDGWESWQQLDRAVAELKEWVRLTEDRNAESYWLAQLLISTSPEHSYVTRDSNALEWFGELAEELVGRLDEVEESDRKEVEDVIAEIMDRLRQ